MGESNDQGNANGSFKNLKYTFLAESGDILYSHIGAYPYRVRIYEVFSIIVDDDGVNYECGEHRLEKKTFQGKPYISSEFAWRHKFPEDCFKKYMFHNYADALHMFISAKEEADDHGKKAYEDDYIPAEEIEKYVFKPTGKFHKDIDRVMLVAEILSMDMVVVKAGIRPSDTSLLDEMLPELTETDDNCRDMCFDSAGNMKEDFKMLINERLIGYLLNEFGIYECDARRLVAYTKYCYVSLKHGDMFHIDKNKPMPGQILFWE